ncbi:MAG TPA: MXAN_6577-like cysteine-rich protein, partial [Myxococcaceae bacterium]
MTPGAAVVAAALVGLLCACPKIGPECGAGKAACGSECADLQADARHCGGCDTACGALEQCVQGACACREGTAACPLVGCVYLSADPDHCGTCGRVCDVGYVCAGSDCVISCDSANLTQCGSSCVDLSTNAAHCGQCGTACAASLSCRGGACTYDVIAACFSTDQLVGISSASDTRGPLVDAPTTPESLASISQSLLVGAAFSQKLYHLDLATLRPKLSADGGVLINDIGPDARQVLVDGTEVYVINAGNNTLQVLRRTGNVLSTIAQLSFGPNANPQAVAKVGTDLFIPLYGSFSGTAGEAAGGFVVRVSVADPTRPTIASYIDLRRVDLHPYGTYSSPRPSWITLFGGDLYVPLNNLDGFAVGGPGMLARIDPFTE